MVVDTVTSLNMDDVNIIIFPVEYARDAMPNLWKDRKDLEPTKGRVVDHMVLSVGNLPETLDRLRKGGVKVTDGAFIEGPDRIRIELVRWTKVPMKSASTCGRTSIAFLTTRCSSTRRIGTTSA